MHDCHSLGLIKHDTVPSFARFCIDFWIGHYNNKKREFATRVQDIEDDYGRRSRQNHGVKITLLGRQYRLLHVCTYAGAMKRILKIKSGFIRFQ